MFCNVFFNICNSLNPEQFAQFQQFLKAVTLCFSVNLGSLWYGVPAACEWVSVMKIYRKQTSGLFFHLGSQPYSIWSSADPVSYSGTYIWALFTMFFCFCYVLCCFLCNLRISMWCPSWDQHNDPNITEKKKHRVDAFRNRWNFAIAPMVYELR